MSSLLKLGIATNHGLSSQKVHHINVMNRNIQHHSHVGNTGRKWAMTSRSKLENMPNFARFNSPLGFHHRRIKSLKVTHHQRPSRLLGDRNHLVSLHKRRRNRLLNQNMGSRLHSETGHFAVELGRCGNRHIIEVLLLNHLAIIGIGIHPGKRFQCRMALRKRISSGNKASSLNFSVQSKMVPAHGTHSDNRTAQTHRLFTSATIRSKSSCESEG